MKVEGAVQAAKRLSGLKCLRQGATVVLAEVMICTEIGDVWMVQLGLVALWPRLLQWVGLTGAIIAGGEIVTTLSKTLVLFAVWRKRLRLE